MIFTATKLVIWNRFIIMWCITSPEVKRSEEKRREEKRTKKDLYHGISAQTPWATWIPCHWPNLKEILSHAVFRVKIFPHFTPWSRFLQWKFTGGVNDYSAGIQMAGCFQLPLHLPCQRFPLLPAQIHIVFHADFAQRQHVTLTAIGKHTTDLAEQCESSGRSHCLPHGAALGMRIALTIHNRSGWKKGQKMYQNSVPLNQIVQKNLIRTEHSR